MQRSRLWSEKKDAIDGAFFQIAGHTFQIVCHTFQPPTFMLRIPKAVDNLTVKYVFIVGGHSVEIQTLTDPKSLTLLLCQSLEYISQLWFCIHGMQGIYARMI